MYALVDVCASEVRDATYLEEVDDARSAVQSHGLCHNITRHEVTKGAHRGP